MKSLTQQALFPHDEECWSSLFRFCDDHGRTLMRPVVKYHASSDFQGGLTNELTETHTTENCGYGFTFGNNYALRQARSNDSFWEVIEDYLGQEKVMLEVRSWDDLVGTEADSMLAAAITNAKTEWQKRIDALLASVPEPEPKPQKKKVDYINDEVVDWDDYDDDDEGDTDGDQSKPPVDYLAALNEVLLKQVAEDKKKRNF